jgi:hypothetical protein
MEGGVANKRGYGVSTRTKNETGPGWDVGCWDAVRESECSKASTVERTCAVHVLHGQVRAEEQPHTQAEEGHRRGRGIEEVGGKEVPRGTVVHFPVGVVVILGFVEICRISERKSPVVAHCARGAVRPRACYEQREQEDAKGDRDDARNEGSMKALGWNASLRVARRHGSSAAAAKPGMSAGIVRCAHSIKEDRACARASIGVFLVCLFHSQTAPSARFWKKGKGGQKGRKGGQSREKRLSENRSSQPKER